MKKHLIYKIVNKVTQKYYVGRTSNKEARFKRHRDMLNDDSHHSIYLQRAWNKYGHDNFDFIIVEDSLTLEQATEKEQYYFDNLMEELYNVSRCSTGGDLLSYHPNRELIINQIRCSIMSFNNGLSPEERKNKYGHQGDQNPMYGKKHSIQAKESISEKNKGKVSYRKGKTFEEAHGIEMAAKLKKELSDLAKKKIGNKNPFYGKQHSDETKRKISEKNKGKKPVNIKSVIIDNVEYESLGKAAEAFNVVPATILHRIRSKNEKFKNYFYKDEIE